MADTPKEGETVVTDDSKTAVTHPATPPTEEKKTDDSEVERFRKEAEQATMRANQLANQLKAKEDAEAKAKAEELEEQNEFKTLYEQEKQKREEVERERATAEKAQAVSEAKEKTLAEYSDEVKALADDTGLNLTDSTDEAIADFKGKLDKIQTRLGSPKVTPNNPGVVTGKKDYSQTEMYEILNDPVKRDAYYRAKDGVTAMMMAPPKG